MANAVELFNELSRTEEQILDEKILRFLDKYEDKSSPTHVPKEDILAWIKKNPDLLKIKIPPPVFKSRYAH